jgi:hypothetical protein
MPGDAVPSGEVRNTRTDERTDLVPVRAVVGVDAAEPWGL